MVPVIMRELAHGWSFLTLVQYYSINSRVSLLVKTSQFRTKNPKTKGIGIDEATFISRVVKANSFARFVTPWTSDWLAVKRGMS